MNRWLGLVAGVWAGLASNLVLAFQVENVRVFPSCVINPRDRVSIEIFIGSGHTPSFLYQPTTVTFENGVISIDVFPTTGGGLSPSFQVVTAEVGSHPIGVHPFVIHFHGLFFSNAYYSTTKGSFEVSARKCPDLPTDRRHLYWADPQMGQIKRAAVNGARQQIIVASESGPEDFEIHGLGLDSQNRELYWAEGYPVEFFKASLDGSRKQFLFASHGGPQEQFELDSGQFFWLGGSSIWTASLDRGDPIPIFENQASARTLMVDSMHKKIYWASFFDGINRGNYDGTELETIVPDLYLSRLLAIDPINQKLYWTTDTSSVPKGFYRSNLDGSDVELLIANASPVFLVLEPVPGAMYWTEHGGDTSTIRRSILDGTHPEDIAVGLPYYLAQLSFDSLTNKLYMLHSGDSMTGLHGSIIRCNLDGTEVETIVQNIAYPVGLAFEASTRAPRRQIRGID